MPGTIGSDTLPTPCGTTVILSVAKDPRAKRARRSRDTRGHIVRFAGRLNRGWQSHPADATHRRGLLRSLHSLWMTVVELRGEVCAGLTRASGSVHDR